MLAATLRLTVLGAALIGGNLSALVLAYWLGGPASVARQIALLCKL